jgi:hypothetical protein
VALLRLLSGYLYVDKADHAACHCIACPSAKLVVAIVVAIVEFPEQIVFADDQSFSISDSQSVYLCAQ